MCEHYPCCPVCGADKVNSPGDMLAFKCGRWYQDMKIKELCKSRGEND